MTSTRDLLAAALAHWATVNAEFAEKTAAPGWDNDPDYLAFERAVPLIAEALEALAAIRDDPHQQYDHPQVEGGGQTSIGIADGHRCAAQKAHTALAALEAN